MTKSRKWIKTNSRYCLVSHRCSCDVKLFVLFWSLMFIKKTNKFSRLTQMDSNPSNTSVFTTETSSTLDSELSLSSEKTSLTNKIEEKQIFIGDLFIYASCLTLLCVSRWKTNERWDENIFVSFLVSFARANDSIYRFTNMLTKSFVLSKSNDTVSFNDLVQNDGEDFWKVFFSFCFN